MPEAERYDAVVIGSGEGGKYLAWHLAQAGRKTAVVERRWVGGSCPNINCLPSKNEIWSAGVARIVARAGEFGVTTGPVSVDMKKVLQRKRDMVDGLVAFHLDRYKASGAELVMGTRASRRAADGRGGAERRRDATAGRRQALPQPRHACERAARARPRRGSAAHQYRGARTRPGSRSSDRPRRRLRRPRIRAGLPALRQPGHHHRSWSAVGQARGSGRLRRGSAHSGGGRRRGAAVRPRSSRWRGGRASICACCVRTPDGRTDDRGHRHPGRGRPHAQHARNRPRRGRHRADRSRLHPRQRSTGDDGARTPGRSASAREARSLPICRSTTFA